MHWTDEAIVLSSRKHGENSVVVRVFSAQHGVFSGVVRSAHAKSNRGVIQPGNLLNCTWQARLAEHIGTLKAELMEANAAQIMSDPLRLAAMSSACALVETALPERHPYPRIYKHFHGFMDILKHGENWPQAYVMLEMVLLAESGFGLDLKQCAATGTRDELIYVSPKSGRAVSKDAGEPYKEKLLPLPPFLRAGAANKDMAKPQETLAGLRLTGYFLEHWLVGPHGKKLPAARKRLMETMKDRYGKA